MGVMASAGADWGDLHKASPLWMPEPGIVSATTSQLTTASGAPGAAVASGCAALNPPGLLASAA